MVERVAVHNLYFTPSDDGNATERCVLYLDMLGFANLTTAHPTPQVRDQLDSENTAIRITPSLVRFKQFHQTLTDLVSHHGCEDSFEISIFSDCAFVVCGTPMDTAALAVGLMRSFFARRVPVRMGLGFGTYYHVSVEQDMSEGSKVHRAMFYGTGIVRSHAAESNKCNKGLRIFVHPAMKPHLGSLNGTIDVLSLHRPDKDAAWELSILYSDQERDYELWKALHDIRAAVPADSTMAVLRQYDCTAKAMNDMRAKAGRHAFADLTP